MSGTTRNNQLPPPVVNSTTDIAQDPTKDTDGILERFRDQLAVFQEGRGVSRSEYGFFTLIAAILSMLAQSVQSLLSLLMALAPVSEISLHVVRFSLERIIDIKNTRDVKLVTRKAVFFLVQLAFILSFISFVLGSILIPVSRMGLSVFGIMKLVTSLLLY
uniref:NAD-dependent malic enzyme n=1 Tax=Lygus hesperus TaxID=30085 RepID=A0A0A9YYB7_LYGHE